MKKYTAVFLSVLLIVTSATVFGGTSVSAEICEKGSAVARSINDEGIVLLKNENNALPLAEGEKITVFGEAQANHYDAGADTLTLQRGYIPFGAGSTRSVNNEPIVAPLDALRQAAENGSVAVNEEISRRYEADADYYPTDDEINAAAGVSDTAIVFISRWGGECRDFKKTDWSLTENEQSLVTSLRRSFKKVVAVLNTGNAIDTSWDNDVDALLFAGYGGFQGGLGIADILTGAVNPSGKLTSTWANSLEDYPTNDAFFSSVQNYTEDIFLGYRYFETFDKENDAVKYPFGYGLSYTDFEITASMTDDGDKLTVTATVKNTGGVAGKEVVEVYCKKPEGKLPQAAKELCGFDKTNTLQPNQSQTVTIEIEKESLASYDDVGKTGKKAAYVMEAGDYEIFVGNSVKNAGENSVGKFTVDELKVVEQLSTQSVTKLDKRLTSDGTTESIPKLTQDTSPTPVPTAASSTPTPTAAPKNENEIIVEADEFDDADGADGGPNAESMPGTAAYLNPETGEWESIEGDNLANTWRGNSYTVYELELTNGGEFSISFRASTRKDYTAVITVYTSSDGITYKEVTKSETFPDTFTLNPDASNPYHNYIDKAGIKTVKLNSGKNYIKLTFTGAPNVDCLTFKRIGTADTSTADAATPTPTPTATPAAVSEPADKDTYYKLFDVLNGKVTLDEFVAQMKTSELATFFVSYAGNKAGASVEVCGKYGISQFKMSDSSQGVGSGSTSYPCETLTASTWNLRLAAAYALSIASEAYTSSIDIILCPAVNLQRHPLSGRNFEYYSEDPFISGKFAETVIKYAQSLGVGCCIKHFVCNEIESNKLASDSRVSERALRELYLLPFEMAVKNAEPWGIMSSYNIINGVAASENGDLLKNIVRGEWGFKGFISGDWNNDKDIVKEINNGNNVREPAANCDIDKIIKAIQNGKITRETLEDGAKQMLYVIMRTKAYSTNNLMCANSHTFENNICTKCYALDKNALTELPSLIQSLLDDIPITQEAQIQNAKSSTPVIVAVAVAAVAAIGGAVTFVIIRKKKLNKR